MGTGRKFNKTNVTRPRKSGPAKIRRQRLHRERLVALGASEAEVLKMTAKDVRTQLKQPVKTAAKYAARNAKA